MERHTYSQSVSPAKSKQGHKNLIIFTPSERVKRFHYFNVRPSSCVHPPTTNLNNSTFELLRKVAFDSKSASCVLRNALVLWQRCSTWLIWQQIDSHFRQICVCFFFCTHSVAASSLITAKCSCEIFVHILLYRYYFARVRKLWMLDSEYGEQRFAKNSTESVRCYYEVLKVWFIQPK